MGGQRCRVSEPLSDLLCHFYGKHKEQRMLPEDRDMPELCCYFVDCQLVFKDHLELAYHMKHHTKHLEMENLDFIKFICDFYKGRLKQKQVKKSELQKNVGEKK